MEKLVKRSDKKAFWGIPADGSVTEYTRMRGFTELSESKNPKEYSRQYIDESFETTDVVGYSPAWSFAFDDYTGNAVLSDIKDILDNELLGTAAQREIVFVDFTQKNSDNSFKAVKRKFSVIGDSQGDSADAYTYSGNLRVVEKFVSGSAVIKSPEDGDSETVETVTFTEATGE